MSDVSLFQIAIKVLQDAIHLLIDLDCYFDSFDDFIFTVRIFMRELVSEFAVGYPVGGIFDDFKFFEFVQNIDQGQIVLEFTNFVEKNFEELFTDKILKFDKEDGR